MTEISEAVYPELLRTTLLLSISVMLLAGLWRVLRIRAAGVESVAWLIVLGQGMLLTGIVVPMPEFLQSRRTAIAAVPLEVSPQTDEKEGASPTGDTEKISLNDSGLEDKLESSTSSSNEPNLATFDEIAAQVKSEPVAASSSRSMMLIVIATLWLAVTITLIICSVFRYVRFLRSLSTVVLPDDWRSTLNDCGGRSVRLLITDNIGPCMGWTPKGYFIAVPFEPWQQLSEPERRAILLHELAHWRRGDVWRLLLGRIATAFHWFNPCAWLALNRLENSTESACDDIVINSVPVTDYARALMSLSSMRTSPSLVHAAGRGRLFQRVARILGPESTARTTRRAGVALFVAVAMFATGVFRFKESDGLATAGILSGSNEAISEAQTDEPKNNSNVRSLLKLGDPRFAHRSGVDSAVFAPNGEWIASTCYNTYQPRIELWDAATGQRSATLVADADDLHGIESIAVSPDGKWLIGGQQDGWMNVWSTADWKLVGRSKNHDASVAVIVFSPDSKLFASGTQDGTVQLCAVTAPAIIAQQWQVEKRPDSKGDFIVGSSGVVTLAFSRDSRRLLTGTGGDANINIIDIESAKIIRTIEHAHPLGRLNPALSSLHVISENQVLSVGARSIPRIELPPGKSSDAKNVQITELKLWNFETGELVRDITAGRFDIGFGNAAVAADGRTAVLGCWDQLIFFDLAEAVELRSIAIPGWWGRTPIIEGNRVAVAIDQRLSLWDLASGRPVLPSPERHPSSIQDCRWTQGSQSATMLDNSGIVNTWDSVSGQFRIQRSFGNGGHGRAMAVSADGSILAAGGMAVDSTGRDFGMVQVWTTDSDARWQRHLDARAIDCSVSADGSRVVVATSNGSIGDTRLHLFEKKGRRVKSLGEFPAESERGLWQSAETVFTADGESVWIADGNSEIIRWDINDQKAGTRFVADWRLIIPGHEKEQFAQIWDAEFCMENQTVVISALNHIMVWDLTNGQLKLDMPIPDITKGFDTLAVSRDGRYVAAAEVLYAGIRGSDTIRVFDLSERKEILALTPHDNRATALSFSPDNKSLLAGYTDGTGEIWNVAVEDPAGRRDNN